MRTVIVRVFDPADGGDGGLRGSAEVPGGEPVLFDGEDELAVVVRRLGTGPRPAPGPPGRAKSGQGRAETFR